MAKWYVQRGEKEFGPFEDKQLKQLAENGKLKPIDVVRREDRQTGRSASEIKGLFPDASEPDLPDLPDADQRAEVPDPAQAVPQASTLQQMKESAATLTEYAKKQAKLKSLDLSEIPSAANELGAKALEHGVGKDIFSQLYSDISQIDSQVSELRSSKPGKATDTITDKLKNASVATVNLAKIELLNRNRKKLVTQLGEQISANETVDPDAMLVSERQRVRDLNSQRDQLAREITEMDMGNKIKDGSKSLYKKRSILRPFIRHPAAIVVFLVGCFPIGLYLLWTNKEWPVVRKAKWTGAFVTLLIVSFVFSHFQARWVEAEIASANSLWKSGDPSAAVIKYRALVDSKASFIPRNERAKIYGRVIDYDAEVGNDTSAKKIAEEAITGGIDPEIESPTAIMIVRQVRESKSGKNESRGNGSGLSLSKGPQPAKPFLAQLTSIKFSTPSEGSDLDKTPFAFLRNYAKGPCCVHIGKMEMYSSAATVLLVERLKDSLIGVVVVSTPFNSTNAEVNELTAISTAVADVLPECDLRDLVSRRSAALGAGGQASEKYKSAAVNIYVDRDKREMRVIIVSF